MPSSTGEPEPDEHAQEERTECVQTEGDLGGPLHADLVKHAPSNETADHTADSDESQGRDLLHANSLAGDSTVDTLIQVADLISDEQFAGTRDGLTQLQRRWYRSRAAREAPRTSVVLVHGIGEHSGRYDHVGRFLAERGHDVLAFDNRGHGQSGGRRGHVDRFTELLDDVEDLIVERRQLGAPVVLFGHSLGGLISTTYLLADRPKPDFLVLSAPAISARVPLWQRLLAPPLALIAPRLFVRVDLDARLISHDLQVQEDYRDDPLRVAGSTARFGNEILTTMAATKAALDRIAVPTYVFHGEEDELVPASVSLPLAELPNVSYRLWPGLRHECLNEPSRLDVLAEIEAWLEGELAGNEQQS